MFRVSTNKVVSHHNRRVLFPILFAFKFEKKIVRPCNEVDNLIQDFRAYARLTCKSLIINTIAFRRPACSRQLKTCGECTNLS